MLNCRALNEMVLKDAKAVDMFKKAENSFGFSYCRINIYKSYLFAWNNLYNQIINYILMNKYPHKCSFCLSKEQLIKRIKNINTECNKFLINNKLANVNFTNFYSKFNYHLIEGVKEELINIIENYKDNVEATIASVTFIITEKILNLIRVELEGMDIFCEHIGNQAMCSDKRCRVGSTNIITLYVNDFYKGFFDKIIEAFSLIQHRDKILLIVDYRNINYTYSWEETGAYERYLKAKQYIEYVYFDYTKYIDFGKHYDEVKYYIIKTEDEYDNLVKSWVETGKPIIFERD